MCNCSTAAPLSMPLMEQVQHLWTGTEYETIRHLIKAEIPQIPSTCNKCGGYDCYRSKDKTMQHRLLWCKEKDCRHQRSLVYGTFFAEAKLSLCKAL